jgi:hypothetical protein
MSDRPARHPITLKRIIHDLESMRQVEVTHDVAYHENLKLDVYHPVRSARALPPAVIIVAGYRDVGVPMTLGCNFREMEFVISLAQLLAVSGMAAVTYSTSAPAQDVGRVADFIARSGAELRIDAKRVGVWASSGNGPVALGFLMEKRPVVRAAVLSNMYTFDAADITAVAEASATYRFVNATAGRSVADLPTDLPMQIVRCGQDDAGLNAALDRFVADAVRANLPITFVNHATAPHAFEINVDTPVSHHILDGMLSFMRFHLGSVGRAS